MKAKIQALESRVTLLTTELLEVREVQDFDRRLANKPERLLCLAQSQPLPVRRKINTAQK